MTLDTQESILNYLYTAMTGDSALQTAMGGTVRLYPIWASPKAEMPYLVHRIDMRTTDFFPIQQSTYLLDIWSESENADEIIACRKAIMELLDELDFDTTEVKTAKLWIQADGFVPETEENIWHYAMQFNIRYYRKSETAAIISR